MFVPNKEYEKLKWSSEANPLKMESARKVATEGSDISVAVCLKGCIIFAVGKHIMREPADHTLKCITPLDIHISAAYTGAQSDADEILETAKIKCQKTRIVLKKRISVFRLAEFMAKFNYKNITIDGLDPSAALFLLGGFDLDGAPRIFEINPSGHFTERKVGAIGPNANVAIDFLKGNFEKIFNKDVSVGIKYLIKGLTMATKNDGVFEVGVLNYGKHITILTKQEKQFYLREVEKSAWCTQQLSMAKE